jgi:superfamily II DNA or RNA helicase
VAYELRPYQREAVEAIFGQLAERRSTLLVLPVGCGKTVVFSEVARRWVVEGRGRVLVLAHREELIHQAAEKLRATGVTVGIEMGDQRVSPLFPPSVVVATVQTMGRARRREAWDPKMFGLIICDEAHHAPSDSYKQIFAYFASAKLLGVTATPDRRAMAGVFESIAYGLDIRDAIKQGYLAPIRQKAVQVEGLDLSKVRTTAGDLNEGELEQVLVEEENLHGIAHPTIELAGDRPTMVFAATVEHAHRLAEVMKRRAGSAGVVALDGMTDRELRRQALRDFGEGKFQFLLNCALFLEGFDAPRIACVAMARPTKSRILYTQAIGRGTRLAPGKTDLLVLDFEGNAGKHSLVCALDVLDGTDDEEVRKKARELIACDPELDIMGALDGATRSVAEAKRRLALSKARYQAFDVDPFQVLGIHAPAGRYSGVPPTPDQLVLLQGKGIDAERLGYDRGQAEATIAALRARQRDGLCTFKQAKVLARAGLNPDVTFEQASRAIDVLARNRWKATDELAAQMARPAAAAGGAA